MPTYSAPDAPADTHRVSLATPLTIAHWMSTFACSEVDLRAAVAARGTRPADVNHHLVHQRLARYPFLGLAGARHS
ncbi:DUF3606 domain-containing protein [Hymenobacter coccineus]|uniref:DUF3606 domain-containing protein n=1 Tax=Hymenobacter coccineus TaxID=1908235 RepID=A0A1G1TJE5_9BACT|nr:DUF3606 domain-containing protein [Hymenobacter coccineus]OGX90995.1 hypothetical protein BEN49_05815 [Hymenobacter coccineus]